MKKGNKFTFTISYVNENKKTRYINTIAKDEKEARSHFSLYVAEDFNYKASRGLLPSKCLITKKNKQKYDFDAFHNLFEILSVNKVSFYGDGDNKDLINGRA